MDHWQTAQEEPIRWDPAHQSPEYPPQQPNEEQDSLARDLASGLHLDSYGYVNAPSLSSAEVISASDAGEFAGTWLGVDWEHLDRVPTGSSVIDRSAVADESGRTYHGYKEGKYFLPNDAPEQDRLDLQHAGFRHLLDGHLYRAPVEDAKWVLDIATGTGIWALEYAEEHPDAQVIGTDLSAIQPAWRLPNCTFLQDDAEDEWLFGSTEDPVRFDFVHLRMVATCFDDPRVVMRRAFDNLRPGGHIEYFDALFQFRSIDDTLAGSAFGRAMTLFADGHAAMGRDLTTVQRYAELLREIGFVDVVEEKYILPLNPWPEDEKLKQIGLFMMTNVHDGMRGFVWKPARHLGIRPEEIDPLIIEAKRDLTSGTHRIYVTMYVVYGRKPAEPSAYPEKPIATETSES